MRSPSSSSSKQAAREGDGNGGGCAGKKVEATPCCSKVGLKRGPWTAEEDELLADYIKREGEGRWRTLPKKAGLLRCGKSCRLRWMNYLRPSVKRGNITPDEEDLILRLHRLLGNRWSLIAGRIPGRTDNEIKNYWNTHLSKKLISQGIDPKTHKPLNPNPTIDNNKDSSPLNNSSSPNFPIPIPIPNPNPNPNQVPSAFEDMISMMISNGDQLRDGSCKDAHSVDDHGEHGPKKDLRRNSNQGNISTNEGIGDDVMINLCPDEAFSSFLNSLINDDMFGANQHQEQGQHLQHSSSSSLI